MDSQRLWQNFKRDLIALPQLGIRVDYSRMGLTPGWLESMEEPLQQAFAAMEQLEGGAVANPDEGRQVGHYWLRAPQFAPEAAIATAIDATIDGVLDFAARVHSGEVAPVKATRFTDLLVVGIGGSALGPQFVADALGSADDRMQVHFLDNTDPDGIDRTLGRLRSRLAQTMTLVISKSGGTPETRNGMLEARAAYEAQGLEFGRHAVAITGKESKLDRYAVEQGFIERFPMWDWVGGRTSVTGVVGLLPAALQGIDIRSLLAGAAEMDRATRQPRRQGNPAAMLALAWHHAGDGKGSRDMVVLPYKDRLLLLSRYLQQLIMESLGKERDLAGNVVHQGIAVYGNKGSTDQHAYVQQLREGVPNFFATFIEVLRDRDEAGIEVEAGVTAGDYLQGFLLGTRRALFEAGRASITVTIPAVDPASVGAMIALYERAVGLYASLVGINAYHQPGVEAGKRAAATMLELQARLMRALRAAGESGANAEQLAAAAGAPEEVESIFQILERLAANPSRGVSRSDGATLFDAIYRFRADAGTTKP